MENNYFASMRKSIAGIIIFILIFAAVYWLTPGKVSIQQNSIVPVNIKAFSREISSEENWRQWWPGKQKSPASFEYNGNTYTLTEKRLSSLVINISKENDSISTELIFIPFENDSTKLMWNDAEKPHLNPLSRLKSFSRSKNINADIHFLLNKIQSFYSNEDHVYSLHIKKDFVADSNFIFTSVTSSTYPTMNIVYKMVDKLKNYVQKNEAKETGYPMLNIHKNSDSSYLARVALPVDKKLADSGDIHYRWMLKGGNILVAEVKGGPHEIEKAFSKMADYIEDHGRVAPAIPFQSLITDRRQEADTNKWVTKVYWPVM